jgi:hypothetical protein
MEWGPDFHIGANMTQFILDSTTAAKLMDMHERVELRDQAGRIVGHFLPGPPRDKNGNLIAPFSDEEVLETLRHERGTGRTWSEIKRDLEAM